MSKTRIHSSGNGAPQRYLMQRREFLLIGSAAVVGLAATDVPAQVMRGVVGEGSLPLLSIGYWPGSLRVSETAPARPVVPANLLRHADASLADGARMRIEGFRRAPRHEGRPISLGVTVRYSGHGSDVPPVHAFSYAATRSSVLANGGAAFALPVDAGEAIELAFDRRPLRTSASDKSRRAIAADVFTAADGASDSASLGMKPGEKGFHLRPGTYFFAVRESRADVAPNWSSVRVDATASLTSGNMLYVDVLGERRPVPFGYVAVTVNAAAEETKTVSA